MGQARLKVVEGELYAVRGKKGWGMAQYNGHQADLRGKHWLFLGVLGGQTIEMDALDRSKVRELSPADRQRFAELDAEYRRAFKEMIAASTRWIDEQRRIQAAAKALCRPRLLVMEPRRNQSDAKA